MLEDEAILESLVAVKRWVVQNQSAVKGEIWCFLEVINVLNMKENSLAEIRVLIKNIIFITNFVNISNSCHILREENKTAHAIATLAPS